ncbi:probable serine/threonine-protein kinase At1g01540 [Vicia villosa]|uniref:probable serine/threonine-protein kinase At1g01540 n=1 Tax=Vicia villosa TaxID=3911 RepID=UPI00273CC24E|nr:probable serine/threonine-protein kinase At1g01540 [Vicia villosa]
MSFYDPSFINTQLSKQTSIFGLHLWVIIGILVGSFIVITLFLISLCLTSRRRKNHHHHHHKTNLNTLTPIVSKEIQEIRQTPPKPEIQAIDMVKLEIHRHVSTSGESRGTSGSVCETVSSSRGSMGPEVSHLGWGRWYTLRELEAATNGLCEESVIGEGGYGIVYKGVLTDGTRIAVKNLLNNKGQAEREFRVEVEIIGRVRHKNLVRLLGYCVEGAHRMLVYEYVDNGNLDQWLHGDVGPVSPMTWDIRMKILLGTAKGLAYLHEGLEPKVVHRDVKSSNILIDRQWNAKVSDFGLAKLLDSDHSFVTTRVMGTFGYVAPEYACTGMLNERSDVYSFGILIMEIISGRNPVDYSRPKEEVNLIEWLKDMVGSRRSEEVVDPKLSEKPSLKALKRALLIALRCVDPDSSKRPKMGHVIHMLEADDVLFREDRRNAGESSRSHRNYQRDHNGLSIDKNQIGGEITDQSEDDSSSRSHQEPTRWRR